MVRYRCFIRIKHLLSSVCFIHHGSMYSRMDQVKFVEDSLWKNSKGPLNAVFHKCYLVHSWILCPYTPYPQTYKSHSSLTHFNPVFHFSTPWKRQKTFGFLTFSGGIEMEHWAKWLNLLIQAGKSSSFPIDSWKFNMAHNFDFQSLLRSKNHSSGCLVPWRLLTIKAW